MLNETRSNENDAVAIVAAPEVAVSSRIDVAKQANPSTATSQVLLARILAMAQRYRSDGNYRQATEMFWTILQEHSETAQAEVAKAELLALAEGYERAGNQRMARSMYERVLGMED